MTPNMNIAVIIPAAGLSKRFGDADKSKLEADIASKPVLLRAIELFTSIDAVAQIIVAVDPDPGKLDTFKFKWADKLSFLAKPVKIVAGGKIERWQTVSNALAALDDNITHVAVHDAARPVASLDMINRVFDAAAHHAAVFPGVPVSSTLRRVDPTPTTPAESAQTTAAPTDPLDAILGPQETETLPIHTAHETVPRENLWQVQTPQIIEANLIRRAYQQIHDDPTLAANITDDIALVQSLGQPTVAVPGDPLNIKITLPEDLALAVAIYKLRTGSASHDPLGPKRKHQTWAQMPDDE